jgi:S-formylglutathione hydrolase FrmB
MRPSVVVLVAVAVAAALTAVAAARLAHQSRDLDEGIRSVALEGRVHALVVLPAGYSDSRKRYPVVYFLHGLPAGSNAYRGSRWLASSLAQAGPAILVMPQGARDSDTDPEYLNWGAGRDWETFVSSELPRTIDARFRTIRNRNGRALIGLSAGGFGAALVGLHNLGRFSVLESWSGYFHPTDPTGTQPLARGASTNVHTLIATLRADERRRPTFVGFYVGSGDARFRAENEQLDRELRAAGVPHLFAVYAGAHVTSLWQRHAAAWLRVALRHLSPPQP